MALIGHYFSSTFGVDKAWMDKTGVFDPTLDIDAPLFIDPFLLPYSQHQEFKGCATDKYDEHIGTIYHLVKQSLDGHKKAWTAALKKFQLGEIHGLQGTCLGYSKGSVRGRGIGPKLAEKSLVWAKEVIELGVKDPELFSSLPLFEDGIGPDMISDMVANIILDCIIDFNNRIYQEIKSDLGKSIPLHAVRVGNKIANLPRNPYDNQSCPVILLPNDILKYLPLMDDVTRLGAFADSNAEIRDRVNAHFSEIFKIRYKREKEEIKKSAMKDAHKFQALLDVIKLSERKPYDLVKDPEGLLIWSQIAETTTGLYKLAIVDDNTKTESERINNVVIAIIEQFKNLVENNRLYQVFYADNKPRHERFSQLLFLAIAKSYCEANNLDISPESDNGAGPVDFKFSTGLKKVIVEIKLSTNGKVVTGYQAQLEAYAKAENAELAHYLVIDVGSLGEKWKRLKAIHHSNEEFKKNRFIHLVDGTPKASASKLAP
ncbi:hypothetical protein [Brucella anthropi]|uniref:hypothetical protein n=1 Tax=Brucella anthropi TaxID=529 RepID=UPI001CFD2895|nr:hypothetical protein [Brucella anthropi]